MPDRVGVELLRDRVRAVALGRFGASPRGTLEVAWDLERPSAAVDALAAHFGRTRRVSLAVGLGFLQVARVTLPPVAAAERRRAVALDPARHFAITEPVVVALMGEASTSGSGEPAFAAPHALVDRWIAAFGAWAPVDSVEAAPAAVARALGTTSGGAPNDGVYELPASDDEIGLIEMNVGRVALVRRVPRIALGGVASDAPAARSLPAHNGLASEWLTAFGAALGTGQPVDVQLVDVDTARAIAGRRTRRVVVAAVACGLALGAALGSVDGARARTLARVDAELATLVPRAAPAESLLMRLATLDVATREAERLSAAGPTALATLAALGDRLPADAVVTGIRVQGDAWQVDGTARSAAAVVPRLDADARFADVRAAAPSSRLEGGGAARETFSVAFRAVARSAR